MKNFASKCKAPTVRWGALYIVYLVIVFLPIMQMGVQCNDDLQWRLYSSQGFVTLLKEYWIAAEVQGRVLSVTQVLSLYLSFFFNRFLNGIAKLVWISFDILGIAYFVKRYFSARIAAVYAIVAPILMQITLQHSPPDAFIGFITIPFFLLLLSFYFFAQYCTNKKGWNIVVSVFLYFWVLCSYEIFILYSPIFALIAFKESEFNFKKALFSIRYHVSAGVLYLILYFVIRCLFPSKYLGNQLGVDSVEQSVNVWTMLIKSGIPGIYATSLKESYIFQRTLGFPISTNHAILTQIVDLRIISVIVLAAVMLWKVLYKAKDTSLKRSLVLLLILVVQCAMLPVVNAVSVSWAGVDTQAGIVGSTVSYLILLLVVLFYCILAVQLVDAIKLIKWRRVLIAGVTLLFVVYGAAIQIWNSTLSILCIDSADRIERIENILDTDIVAGLNVETIYSPSICAVYHMQNAEEGYWRKYSRYYDVPRIVATKTDESVALNLLNAGKECLLGNNVKWVDGKAYSKELYFFSESAVYGKEIVFFDRNNEAVRYTCVGHFVDNEYYVEYIALPDYVSLDDVAVMQ